MELCVHIGLLINIVLISLMSIFLQGPINFQKEKLHLIEAVNNLNLDVEGFFASAIDLKQWYLEHPHPFYMIVYDDSDIQYGARRDKTVGADRNHLWYAYNVMLSDFSMSVTKRGRLADYYSVSISLEEV